MGPDAATRQELYLKPILICELFAFLTGYVTVNPHLFHLRFWLIPVTLGSIWFLCTNFAYSDPWLNTFNFGICAVGFTITMKLVEFASLDEPPKYDGQPACTRQSVLCWDCALNTMGYLADTRCLHWNNDSPCHIPEDTRRDGSHLQFYTHTFLLFLKHLLYLDTLQAIIANTGTLGVPQGDTIFRDTFAVTNNFTVHLPHPLLGALPLAFAVGLVIMNAMPAGHYLITLLAAPLTWLPPSISPYSLSAPALKKEWPPLFDHPLNATSLRDFWSNRWHAVFKRNFWVAGGKPGVKVGGYMGGVVGKAVQSFSVQGANSEGKATALERRMRSLGARIGGVMGVFLMSGLLHDLGTWGMGQGTDFRRITGYFLIQGVGLIIESALGLGQSDKREDKASVNGNGSATNEKECGNVHSPVSEIYYRFMKLWTLVWVVLPVPLMMDAWLQRGLAGVVIVPHSLSPARALLKIWNDFAFGR